MRVDVDYIISLLKEYTPKKNSEELGEQDAAAGGGAASGGGSGSGGYPTVTKWESGVTRGPANQIGVTKWNEIVKINRGKANTLL
jgi:hypothetical protein